MEKRITFYPPQTWRGRFLGTILTLVALLLGATQAEAQQRVHIGLDNGSLLGAFASDDDLTDSGWGFKALWRHEQLALSVTGSDRDGLLPSGDPSVPGTVFGTHMLDGKKCMTIVGGRRPSYIVVSLPKGYRILSYEIELVNDLDPTTTVGQGNPGYYNELKAIDPKIDAKWQYINKGIIQESWSNNATTAIGTMRFYETAPWDEDGTNSGTHRRANADEDKDGYNASRVRNIEPGSDWRGDEIGSAGLPNTDIDYIVQAKDASGNGDIRTDQRGRDKVFKISRTAYQDPQTGEWDMGNQLYFRLVKDYYGYGLTIKSFVIRFNAEGTFEAPVVAESAGAARSVVESPFETSKTDIGLMGLNNKEGVTYYTYNYKNVHTLTGYNYLYQESAVPKEGDANLGDHTVGVPVENYAADKHIRPVQARVPNDEGEYENQTLFALGTDTYFIETPIDIATQTIDEETNEPIKAPIGYRIVGALFTPLWVSNTNVDGYSPGPYELKIWNRDCSESQTITIDSSTDADLNKVYDVGLCNNDAIKFEVKMTGNNASNNNALVRVKLLLQALDPYIEKMDIVCTDKEHEVLQLTQSFTADDFSVSGGKFIFYVPEDYRNDVLKFTFSDLYTKYGDETYYGGSIGTSRYSYVTSDYFKEFSGNQNPAGEAYDFPVNGGLYDANYSPAGPDDDDPNFIPYTDKVRTSTAGNIRFKFNNAEDLAALGEASQGEEQEDLTGSLIEYPFSVTDYIGSIDPDNKTSETGQFKPCELMASPSAGYQNTGTFYVFTADETRYNIAPTTAWQHRFYAFYRMEIEAVAKSFLPQYTWTKIYDETCYDKDGNGTDTFDSMWGVSVKATDVETGEVLPEGYLTYQEIINYILYDHPATTYSKEQAEAYNEEHNLSEGDAGYKEEGAPRTEFIGKQLDPTNTKAPASMKQILYVDGSDLYAMVNSSTNQVDTEEKLIVITLNDLKKELSKNNLVFLPEGTIEKVDNAAYKTSTGFQAGQNIILHDKNPFFSPYDISVGTDDYATYSRELTLPSYDVVTNATVMLPFSLKLKNGKHTNPKVDPDDPDEKFFAFTVNTMKTAQGPMDYVENSNVNYGTGYFIPLNSPTEEELEADPTLVTESSTEANIPYMIKVTDVIESVVNNDKISFEAKQKGATIIATPKVGNAGKKEIEGEKATGSFGGGDYDFTNFGSYSGVRYDRVDGEDIFFFAQNMYLNLHQLNGSKRYLYSYPFRGVYKYTSTNAKQMRGFYISYDMNPFQSVPTGIDNQDAQADLMVKVGKGEVTLSATRAQDVTFYTMGGITMKRVDLEAGDTKTVKMPAGVYMVNGVKIIVK